MFDKCLEWRNEIPKMHASCVHKFFTSNIIVDSLNYIIDVHGKIMRRDQISTCNGLRNEPTQMHIATGFLRQRLITLNISKNKRIGLALGSQV